MIIVRFYCISDNIDTQIGLRLVGIEGQVVHKRREFLELLETKQQKPLLVEIPDRHGESKIGETIDKYVSEAIGVKL